MEQKFIAGLYFVFAMLTTNAMAQTPPPGTIPIATVTFPIMPFRPEISLDGDRIAIQTVGTQSFADFTRLAVIEKGSAGWVQIPVTSSIPFPSGGVGRPIAFEGNRIATDMVGLSGRNSPPPIIWGRTGTGWQLQAIPRFQEDLACAGFSPDGIYSFMFDSVTLPNGFTNGVLRVNACEAGLVKAKATLSPPSNPIGGYQLHRYALSGDTMVVGFKYSDGSIFPVIGASGFHAYVYNRSRTAAGAVWSFGGELPLPQSAVAANQIYSPGEDLAIDGNTIAISAPSEAMSVPGVGTVEAGAVYVFERAGATWTQKARLTRSRMNRHFGSRVAVSGDRLLVGSDITPFTVNPGPGEAYLYQRVNGIWNITPNVLRRIANSNDTLFGSGVALIRKYSGCDRSVGYC